MYGLLFYTKSFQLLEPSLHTTYTIEQIIDLVKEHTGKENVLPGTDIFDELDCAGEDFDNLLRKYKARFKVTMKQYLWYFHNNEEGENAGSVFFKPPYERVERIPVTPEMLLTYANIGKWSLAYPEHEIPSARVDFLINVLLVFAAIFLILYVALKR